MIYPRPHLIKNVFAQAIQEFQSGQIPRHSRSLISNFKSLLDETTELIGILKFFYTTTAKDQVN